MPDIDADLADGVIPPEAPQVIQKFLAVSDERVHNSHLDLSNVYTNEFASHEVTMQAVTTQSAVTLKGVSKRFSEYTAIENVSLEIEAGKFIAIVGPSGCGKSTVLNIIAGLLAPTAGAVEIFGIPLKAINRRASYMFQQDALLPWKTVTENVKLGLVFRDADVRKAHDSALEWIHRVGLDGFADRYPHELSGGMRKRVATAQTWIVDPAIVLMDEPFGALDVHTRLRMEVEILNLWAQSGKTVIFVTHDLEEAISLSDQVAVLSTGPASRVIGVYPVDLPRPRNLIDIKTDPRFVQVYRSIWGDLREEVLKSYARV